MNATIKVLAQDNDLNYDVLLTIMRSGVNRNKWDYQNIAEYANTFLGTPILCAYVNGQIADGHNMSEVIMPDGEVTYDFRGATAERIVGAISDNPDDIEIKSNEDGDWIVAKGKLWRFYNRQLVDHIADVGQMETSAETEVYESHMNNEIEVFTKWRGLGVTILNEKVAPAIPGANIKALQEIESEFKELKLKVASHNIVNDEEEMKTKELVANEETNDEPQPKTTERNEKTFMDIYSKKQLAELASKFEGYKVLLAGQDEEGIHVCLMSEKGDTAVYTMEGIEDVIDPKKISRVSTKTCFRADNWELAVDLDTITDDLTAKLIESDNQLEMAKNELQTATETINSMTEKEMKRRLSAAKEKAQMTLDAFNANREDKVDAKVLSQINEAIENGEFSECVNAEGDWCGEEEVMNKVLAACAKEVMELDRKSALAHNSQFIWEGMNKNSKAGNGDVESLLSQFGIE